MNNDYVDKYNVGDIVELKKAHPCGNKLWEITKKGVDFRIKCIKCLHQVIISRVKFEKSVKRIATGSEN